MPTWHEYRFRIDALSPDSLPMAKLAEYMTDLATILGEKQSVRFIRLEQGSAVLVHSVEDGAHERVNDRVEKLRDGDGPTDALNALQRTRRRLNQDGASAFLTNDAETEIIAFPRRTIDTPAELGPFNQKGALDGTVFKVGGKSNTVPVHLKHATTIYKCRAEQRVARELAHHLFGPKLRVRGEGSWTRKADGNWNLNHFTIHNFEVLEEKTLSEAIAELREIPGNGWLNLEDPWSELMSLREDNDETR